MIARRLVHIVVVLIAGSTLLLAQPKYRTFNQNDLGSKKAKAGKALGSTVCFTFRNDSTGVTVNSLHARFNSRVVVVLDSGGFTTIDVGAKEKVLDFTGRTIAAGDSVIICLQLEKKAPGSQANYWWWNVDDVIAGNKRASVPGYNTALLVLQPNGGNVREFLYKRVITRPKGIVIGILKPDSAYAYGWVRYKTADRKYYQHSGTPRCFDVIVNGNGGTKLFRGELKNPHVKKHNNNLLGDLHALKLSIVANDSGVTEPDTSARFGDLIYNDLANPGDPCNGKNIRQIAHLADSALTYCNNFSSSFYATLDNCIGRIIAAFDGPYVADAIHPLHIKGTHAVSEYLWLSAPPDASPVMRHREYSSGYDLPKQSSLQQNYPNPFNPTTTIAFSLMEESVVSLKIFNMLGQEVALLLDNELVDEGDQSIEFDASSLSSGTYFYKLIVRGTGDVQEQFTSIKRMVLLK